MKRVSDILVSILVILVLSTVFNVDRDLFNGIVSGKYFRFYASMTLLSALAIPAIIIKRKERLSFKLPDLLILLFCVFAVLITINHTDRLTNKCLLLIFATAFYFYLRIFLAGRSNLIYNLCCLAFVITGLVEAVWGLRQLYGFTSSQHNLFKITGSFFNPGPYSGWLAMVFPVALLYTIPAFTQKFPRANIRLHELFSVKNFVFLKTALPDWVKIAVGLLTVLCIILVLPAAMSRASWLAALGGSAFIGIIYGLRNKRVAGYFKKHRKRVFSLLFVAVVMTVIALTGLFMLKKDSASGRAFIWKIALQTVRTNPFGVGLGNFGGSYGDVQAAYFASGAGSEREEYVAGGVEYAFNEYLQICIETGIAPFLVFLAFVICVLHLGVRNRNYFPAGSLVALLIFASMSYPFNVLPFVIAFIFLSVLCIVDNNSDDEKPERKRLYPKFAVWAFLITVPVSIALLSCGHFQFYRECSRTQMLHNMNMHREVAEEYLKQYPYLQDEIRFLFEYAQSLSKSEQYAQSNEILQSAIKISCDPMLYNVMGKNYQAQK
ncbi:MAG: O-antigen ligase family protein, partial [Dysgonamonadaceae bacterium]|nr:O-antigen ligase family protein [Dysgonamonadaceae bacterium]